MNNWVDPFILESKIADIISRQARHACNFDKRRASWYVHLITENIINIDKDLVPKLPMQLNTNNKNFYKKPFKLNGDFMAYVKTYADKVGLTREEINGPFSPCWYTPFDPSKIQSLKEVMLDNGWNPTEWNFKKVEYDVPRNNKGSYNSLLSKLPFDKRETIHESIERYIDNRFRNKSKPYMKQYLKQLGFNPNRPPTFEQIRKRLLCSPYWPTSPKFTEDSDNTEDHILSVMLKRMQWTHRKGLLEGLIERTRDDGKIEGQANPCATPTARMAHRGIANIPSVGSLYGDKIRSLFQGDSNDGSPPMVIKHELKEGERLKPFTNMKQVWDDEKEMFIDTEPYRIYIPENTDLFVGGDGSGLELRMLSHYLIWVCKMKYEETGKKYYYDALQSAYAYRDQILEGDIHTHNQKLAGLPTRAASKRFIYAFLYGAGNALLGELVNGGEKEGKAIRETFLRECPCIPVLIEWAEEQALKTGCVPALDGRSLIMRKDFTGKVQVHKSLNMLLQAAGSIVMKVADCFLIRDNAKNNLTATQVIFYHDEFQYTCPHNELLTLQANINNCVRKAGEYFHMECPLASDSLYGRSWLHTH